MTRQFYINRFEEFFPIFAFLVFSFLVIAAVVVPLMYFDGMAKSAWLKQSRGMDIPWHQACFLDVKINEVDASIKSN